MYRFLLRAKIDESAVVYARARFFGIGGLSVGAHSIVGEGAFLDCRRGIVIADNVNIASEVRIWTQEHDISSDDFGITGAPVKIGSRAFIGSRVTILPGVEIGEGAVVGAGAVVTKNVPRWTVVYGVPARPAGSRRAVEYTLNTRRPAWFQ